MKKSKIKFDQKIKLDVPEPSGICASSDKQSFFIVSDRGVVYNVDLEGNIIRKAEKEGNDFEGIVNVDGQLYVVDEEEDEILVYTEKDLSYVKKESFKIKKKENKGWEAITYLPDQKQLIAFQESDPVRYYLFSENLELLDKKKIKIVPEVSAATYYEGFLWLVSDEEQLISKVNLFEEEVIRQWKIDIKNPEGICFLHNQLYIISDRKSTLYMKESNLFL